jgi:uncharacterized protein (DUF934 family)
MPRLIKDRAVVDDAWSLLREAATPADLPADVPVIVPLALWLAHREALSVRGKIGVLLAPADDPGSLSGDVGVLPLIAVDFPKFGDGRGYSTARLLREKYGFRGELRAVGDVLRDQLYYLHACGFDALAVRADRDPTTALASLDDFSDNYQSTVGQPLPLFRRRAEPGVNDPGGTSA